jgi:hypothetical protein
VIKIQKKRHEREKEAKLELTALIELYRKCGISDGSQSRLGHQSGTAHQGYVHDSLASLSQPHGPAMYATVSHNYIIINNLGLMGLTWSASAA